MVIALIALFVAMGGTATALQGRNTIFSDDITNGEVKSPDIGTGHVRSPDLQNNGVLSGDLRDGGVTHVDIANAPSGSDAVNADTLDGADRSTLLGKNEKAADADLLDGMNSSQFLRLAEVRPGDFFQRIDPGYTGDVYRGGEFVELEYSCPSSLSSNGTVRVRNWSRTHDVSLFSDNGGGNPNSFNILTKSVNSGLPGGNYAQGAAATGDHMTLSASRMPLSSSGRYGYGNIHIEVFSIHRNGSCWVQGNAFYIDR